MEFLNGGEIKKSETANIIIYSKQGGGKTTVAGLLPGKTLMLSIDGTEQVLEGYTNVDVAKINKDDPHNSIIEFYKIAKMKQNEYDNIFIDNFSHYQKLWLIEKGKHSKSGMPELKDYALFDNHILGIMEAFNDLKANCIYTFWETTRTITHEDGQTYTQFVPDIRDKIINHLLGVVHVVGRLMTKSDGERGFLFKGSESVFAKNHLSKSNGCPQDELIESLKGSLSLEK